MSQTPNTQDSITELMGAVTFGQSFTIDPDGYTHFRDENTPEARAGFETKFREQMTKAEADPVLDAYADGATEGEWHPSLSSPGGRAMTKTITTPAKYIDFEGDRYFRSVHRVKTYRGEYEEQVLFVSSVRSFGTRGQVWSTLALEGYEDGLPAVSTLRTDSYGEGLWIVVSEDGSAADRQISGTCQFSLWGDRKAVRRQVLASTLG